MSIQRSIADILTSAGIRLNTTYLAQHPAIEGLFLMGSRAVNEQYRDKHNVVSDVDCCIIVSEPLSYDYLQAITATALGCHQKVELCARLVSQVREKNKFNYDLKNFSLPLYVREKDPRQCIPRIEVTDFTEIDVTSVLLAALDCLCDGLLVYYQKPDEYQTIAIELERALRKLRLYVHLKHGQYPVNELTHDAVEDQLHADQKLLLRRLANVRSAPEATDLDLSETLVVLIGIIGKELEEQPFQAYQQLAADSGPGSTERERLHFINAQVGIVREIYRVIGSGQVGTASIADNVLRERLTGDYQRLIAGDRFIPPAVVNGGYRVLK